MLTDHFSAHIVYILYTLFKEISIFKPVVSRGFNSEKYLICKNYNKADSKLIDHLIKINETMNSQQPPSQTKLSSHSIPPKTTIPEKIALGLMNVETILDADLVLKDTDFIEWMTDSNDMLAMAQIKALKTLVEYAENPRLYPYDVKSISRDCFQEWRVPNVEHQYDSSERQERRGDGRSNQRGDRRDDKRYEPYSRRQF